MLANTPRASTYTTGDRTIEVGIQPICDVGNTKKQQQIAVFQNEQCAQIKIIAVLGPVATNNEQAEEKRPVPAPVGG